MGESRSGTTKFRTTYADTHCSTEEYFRAWWVLMSLFLSCCGSRMFSPTDRKLMELWADAATHIWLSKQNPKYSFLSYHATQHRWNITCILLEGETRTTLLFPTDTVDVLGEGQREPEPRLDEMRSDPHWAESEPSLDAAMLDIFGS